MSARHTVCWPGAVALLVLVACSDSTPPIGEQGSVDGPAADAGSDIRADDVTPPVDGQAHPEAARAEGGANDLGSLKATVTNETWYQGSKTCTEAGMTASGQAGQVLAKLVQIPAASVPGTCIPHTATVSLVASDLALSLHGSLGSACWTACWDFDINVTGVSPGTYSVSYLSFKQSVVVP